MPVFSKMMGSYPFQLIRGLSPRVKMGLAASAGVGALVGTARLTSRRSGETNQDAAMRASRMRPSLSNIAGGVVSGLATYGAIKAAPSVMQFGRNMMRPGVRGMYGGLLRNKGEAGLAGMMKRAAGFLKK